MGRGEFWIDSNQHAVIYEDGEIYVDGQKRGKLYSDGELYIDGIKRGKLYSDGELYIDGSKAGKLYSDGEFWAEGQKIGKLYNKEGMTGSESPSYGSADSSGSWTKAETVGSGATGGEVVAIIGILLVLLLIILFFMASYKSWVYMFGDNLSAYSDTPVRMILAGILIVIIQMAALVMQIKRISAGKAGWGIKTGLLYHTIAAMLHMTLALFILDGIPSDFLTLLLPIVFVCFVIALLPTAIGCFVGNVWSFIIRKRK